ncbi:MAG: hypothetical protein K9G62_08125 [Alphaproteobacteria bacterium]|nr:hypothetical protein [Alphaproteobacteria bacterium]
MFSKSKKLKKRPNSLNNIPYNPGVAIGEITQQSCLLAWQSIGNQQLQGFLKNGEDWHNTPESRILKEKQDLLNSVATRIEKDENFPAAVQNPQPSHIRYNF